MAITAGSGTPCLPASVTNPDRRLCAPKSPSSPAKAARRLTIVATEPGSRAGPTRGMAGILEIFAETQLSNCFEADIEEIICTCNALATIDHLDDGLGRPDEVTTSKSSGTG